MDIIFHEGGIKKVFITNRRWGLREKGGVRMTLWFQALLPGRTAIIFTETGE